MRFVFVALISSLIGCISSSADEVVPEGLLSYHGRYLPEASSLQDRKPSPDCAWVETSYRASDIEIPITITRDPLFEIGLGEVEVATIYEQPPFIGESPSVAVELEVEASADSRIAASLEKARSNGCGDVLEILFGRRHLGGGTIHGRRPGSVSGGQFLSRAEAEALYALDGERPAFVALAEDERAYWEDRNEKQLEWVLWTVRCAPSDLAGSGFSLEEFAREIEAAPSIKERFEQADCKTEPPFPIQVEVREFGYDENGELIYER